MYMQRRSQRSLTKLLATTSVVALAAAGLTMSSAAADPDSTHGLSLAKVHPVQTGSAEGDKAPSSALARTPAGLKTITSEKLIPVMIKYDYDALASYTGTVQGLAATSPSVTDRSLRKTRSAEARYLAYVSNREQAISADVTAAVPSASITRSYRIVYGGVAAIIPGNSVRSILKVPGVVAVQRDALNHMLTDSSTDFINAPAAYAALHTRRNAGQGVLLGNLDTGVWPEHPSFADQGNLPAYTGPAAATCDFGDNPLTVENDPFVCNNKLVGGEAFTTAYDASSAEPDIYAGTARDGGGHGSHTASTSAGNVVTHVETLGPTLARINGVAPGAQIKEYKVCGPEGCFSSDSAAAVEQAIVDGVDVINFSISGGSSPMTDPVELAFLDAYNAGVFVAASAGNSGPGAGTTDHLGPWVTTVAASTQTRAFTSHLTLTAGDGDTFESDGSTITAGAGPLPVVSAADAPYSSVQCLAPAAAGTFTGKIVVCRRGGNGRAEKGYNVLQGGAAGMILYNPTLADTETDNHWLPAIHLADGTALVAFLGSHTGITGQFTAGAKADGQGDVMAAFSSRGPGNYMSIKPDITAPGVQILAAMTPAPIPPPFGVAEGPAGQYYQAIAGTSMSSPHIAGVALLLRALHPAWTPGQIKSAMMTQARTSVVKEDLTTPADPFDMGAGRVDVARSMKTPVTISATAGDFAALTPDPVHAIDLNIPSINAPVMPGLITTTRTLQNVTGGTLHVTARAVTGPGTRISFSPAKFTIPKGKSKAVQITVSSTAPVDEPQFAAVRFDTDKGSARLPVAFTHAQGSVTLDQTCDAASVPKHQTSTCTVSATNTDFTDQTVSLETSTSQRLRVVAANGASLVGGKAKVTVSLAGAALGVPSVDPGALFGYIPLSALGVAPIGIGDEDMINFNVPSFVFNGQSYSAIGVDSNGYLVVGGGTSLDNECCNLPTGPSSAPPNNILAPFWTDLDGSDAEGIRADVLTDGVNNWLVVEWQVNVWGTSDLRTFQTWIGVDGTQDITFAYDPTDPPTDPAGQAYLVGAENEAGQGDVSAFLPAEDQRVTSTDPVPGDTVTYQVTVKGLVPGSANVRTEMTASQVAGVTVVDTPLPVTW
jgi:hypothetical protein